MSHGPGRTAIRLLALAAPALLAGSMFLRGAPAAEPLTVYAASSVTEGFGELGHAFEQSTGARVRFNFGASSALQAQIARGAPADVFAAADPAQMRPLLARKQVEAPRVFARNRLTIVVPAANPGKVQSPKDLARPGLRLVTTAETVPIGRYTREALAKLASRPGYPADFSARVSGNVMSREPNVRGILAKVELGEADAAIVYETDARASRRVRAIPLPAAANVTAEYPVAIVTGSSRRRQAAAFVRFVLSPEGRRILKGHGFR